MACSRSRPPMCSSPWNGPAVVRRQDPRLRPASGHRRRHDPGPPCRRAARRSDRKAAPACSTRTSCRRTASSSTTWCVDHRPRPGEEDPAAGGRHHRVRGDRTRSSPGSASLPEGEQRHRAAERHSVGTTLSSATSVGRDRQSSAPQTPRRRDACGAQASNCSRPDRPAREPLLAGLVQSAHERSRGACTVRARGGGAGVVALPCETRLARARMAKWPWPRRLRDHEEYVPRAAPRCTTPRAAGYAAARGDPSTCWSRSSGSPWRCCTARPTGCCSTWSQW